MIKIIFRTSQVSITTVYSLFSIYHNTITHKRQSDNPGFIRWVCSWENTLSCDTTNTKSLNIKRKTRKHIIHRKQNILVKCKLGSGRLVRLTTRDGSKIERHNLIWFHIKMMFVSCNLTDKMYMVYPDKIYVASADALGPGASAVPTLNNFIQSGIGRTCIASANVSRQTDLMRRWSISSRNYRLKKQSGYVDL